jgi:hypothetical protein
MSTEFDMPDAWTGSIFPRAILRAPGKLKSTGGEDFESSSGPVDRVSPVARRVVEEAEVCVDLVEGGR